MGLSAICSVFSIILIVCGSEGVYTNEPREKSEELINQLLIEVRDLREKYVDLKHRQERTEQDKVIQDKTLNQLSIELQNLKSRHTELKHQQEKTTRELRDVQNKYNELRHEHTKTVSELHDIQNKYSELNHDHTKTVSELQKMKNKYKKASLHQNNTPKPRIIDENRVMEQRKFTFADNTKAPVLKHIKTKGITTQRSNQRMGVYGENAIGFTAKLSTSLSNLGRSQIIIFDTVVTNIGNSYNPVTGIFTCKYAGMYMFFSNILGYPEKRVGTEIVKNGNNVIHIYSANHIYFGNGCNMAVLQLNVGDTVWTRIDGDYHASGTEIDRGYTSFSGFLLN